MKDVPAWPRAMKGVGRELSPQQQLACLLRITASEGWTENIAWIPTVGVRYHLGVDGLSVPLLAAKGFAEGNHGEPGQFVVEKAFAER